MIKHARKNSGFTLIEFLIVFGILSIIIGVVGVTQRDLFTFNTFFAESFSNQRDIEIVIQPMISEIRAATQSNTGSYAIEAATETSFAFYSNIDSDTDRERVQYFLDGTNLMRSEIHPIGIPLTYSTTTAQESLRVVLRDVVASSTRPIFVYYDGTYAGTSTPLNVPFTLSELRHLEIELTLDRDSTQAPPPVTVKSRVSIRNLKDNY